MKKPLLLCTVFLCFFLLKAKAQTDTTKYDLGRVQINKKLANGITIKAADLEKMPFTSLADAINVWLYGVYGGPAIYVPVIDGIVMTDVNALSIYDIDEITLVQNATATLNGASQQQFLLLIKTRRDRPGKSGIEVAGQTNLVKLHIAKANSSTEKSNTQFYNQYYLSGHINTSKVNAGISVDYQRDATPSTSTTAPGTKYDVGYAESVNRYKLNGYLDAKLGNSSTLSLSTGYVPQNGNGSNLLITGSTPLSMIVRLKENLYYSNLSLNSSFSGFKNTFTGGYQHLKTADNIASAQVVVLGGNPYSELQNNAINNTANNVLIKDNLSYAFKSGIWAIEPNINFMYRHYKVTNDQTLDYNYYSGSTPVYDTTATASDDMALKQSLLTPAININYGKMLMLQGGFQVMLSSPGNANGYKPKRIYPFASVMLDIIDKETHSMGLSVFGSFANVNSYMGDISNYIAYTSSANNQYIASTYYTPAATGLVNPYINFNQWQAGANFSLLHNQLSFSYNFSSQKFDGIETSQGYHYTGTLYLHRLGIDMDWFKSTNFSWETNLNASLIKGILYINAPSTSTHYLTTGGFINRLNYKKAFLGADVLYLLRDHTAYGSSSNINKDHAFNLQNLYAGFKVNVNGTRNVEIYANARNLIESKGANTTLLDSRKYYGLGFKAGL